MRMSVSAALRSSFLCPFSLKKSRYLCDIPKPFKYLSEKSEGAADSKSVATATT
ncbi:hypothetical protein [Candidatus Endomicrobiellum agilis]|uniref:hypothetical protein n=1 Tax=Candidatus Endomicrobiellum agilis TaxID=3238957 RepID=UPI0035A8FAB2